MDDCSSRKAAASSAADALGPQAPVVYAGWRAAGATARWCLSSHPAATAVPTLVAATPGERQPGALAGRRESGCQQAHRRVRSHGKQVRRCVGHGAGTIDGPGMRTFGESQVFARESIETCIRSAAVLRLRRPPWESPLLPMRPAVDHACCRPRAGRSSRWLLVSGDGCFFPMWQRLLRPALVSYRAGTGGRLAVGRSTRRAAKQV